jgi:predicted dienelactone hydrolase
MRPMIRRVGVCAIVCAFLFLVRANRTGVTAAPANPSATVPAALDLGAPDTGQFPSEGPHTRGEHLRFKFMVGHRVITMDVPGSAGKSRPVDVHLWYPADPGDYVSAPPTEYTSALNGVPLSSLWDPLSWKVASRSAREGPSIFRGAPKYPVIVFSHGNTNTPIDNAFTMEDLASAGFIVAAPTHVNNSQDDVRMDFANDEAVAARVALPFTNCVDGRPWSRPSSLCSLNNVALSMADRAHDVTYTLDALPAAFENRVDLDRVGMFGHSRGTATALTVAGGSAVWGIGAEPRIKAVMGMAIAAPAITFNADIKNIRQPTLLVSGGLDVTSPSSVTAGAIELLPGTTESSHVIFPNAVHRTFNSTYCEQMQSAAAVYQLNSRAVLDFHTASRILKIPPNGNPSGVGMNYCGYESFSSPVNIIDIVETLTATPTTTPPTAGFVVTETTVPTTGLTVGQLRSSISEMAVMFFEHTIGRSNSRWHHFQDDFPIGWFIRH